MITVVDSFLFTTLVQVWKCTAHHKLDLPYRLKRTEKILVRLSMHQINPC